MHVKGDSAGSGGEEATLTSPCWGGGVPQQKTVRVTVICKRTRPLLGFHHWKPWILQTSFSLTKV